LNINELFLGKKLSFSEDELRSVENNKLSYYLSTIYKDVPAFQSLSKQCFILNSLYQEELLILNQRCEQSNIELVVIKGGALLKQVYQLNERWMADIDLLISPNDLVGVKEIFTQLDYQEWSEEGKWKANEHKFHFKKFIGEIELTFEIHTKLTYRLDDFFKWHTVNADFLVLSDTDCLAYLIYHLGNQHTYISLHWFLDIYLYINKSNFTFDEDRFNELLSKLEIRTSTSIIYHILEKHFPYHKNLEIFKRYSTLKGRFLSIFLNNTFLWSSPMRDWRYLLIKFLTQDNIITSFKYTYLWFRK
tara:strand:+ start:40679 stop:41590 length:912 start_codon:yes stop_codon:yes gene_type:complete